MQTKHFTKTAHPWMLGVSLLVVGIFMGAGIQVMRAQTAPFTDPTCNPGEACNPNGTPIVSTSGSTQTISSPLTVTGAVGINGDITLGAGYKLTRASSTGKAISVSSSSDYTIVASNSSNTTPSYAAIYASGTNTASGVYAITVNGNAIYGKATSASGLAGFFEGNTKINGNLTIGSVTDASPMKLAIPYGNLEVNGLPGTPSGKISAVDIVSQNISVTGNFFVNGNPVVSGDMRQTILTANIPTSGTKSYTPYQIFGSVNGTASGTVNQYKLMNLQVLTKNAALPATAWTSASSALYSYQECSGTGSFSGTLTVNAPISPSGAQFAYRIIATYKKETTTCVASTDYEAPTVSITSPVGGAGLLSSTTAQVAVNATDNTGGGVTKLELYVNGVYEAQSAASPISFNASKYLTNPVSSITMLVKAYDAAGNIGSSWPISVTVQSSLCSPGCSSGNNCIDCTCNGGPTAYICLPNAAQCPACPVFDPGGVT